MQILLNTLAYAYEKRKLGQRFLKTNMLDGYSRRTTDARYMGRKLIKKIKIVNGLYIAVFYLINLKLWKVAAMQQIVCTILLSAGR